MLGRLVSEGLGQQHDVVGLDIVASASDPSVAIVDILDSNAVTGAMKGCDAVIHLAAIDGPRVATGEAFFRTNALGTWNVFAGAEELGIQRVVLCSSVAALGLSPSMPPVSLPIGTDHPTRPVTAYGISKLAAETVAEGFARRGLLQVVCIRSSLVTFPHQVASWAIAAAKKDGLPPPMGIVSAVESVPEDLPLTNAYVGPDDVVRAFIAAVLADNIQGFNLMYVTAEDTMSRRPTLEVLRDNMQTRPTVTQPEIYQRLAQASPYDLEPARRILGWAPQWRWSDVVKRYALERA